MPTPPRDRGDRVDTGLTIRIPLDTEYAPYALAYQVDADVLAWLGQAPSPPTPERHSLARCIARLTAWRTR